MEKITRKNVILITIDSLRKDHCSCYGYQRKTTPFLDYLAKKGVKFNYAFSNGPLTPRSFPSILCGATAFEGKEDNIQSYFIPKSLITIAQRMQKKGYFCVAFQSGNPFLSKYYGYNRGFNEFFDYLENSSSSDRNWLIIKKIKNYLRFFIKKKAGLESVARKLLTKLEYFKRLKQIKLGNLPFERGIRINKDIDYWLKNYNENKPLFIWIHYMDVHQPHIPQENMRKELGIKKYSIYKLAKYWAEINNHTISRKENIKELIDLYDCEIRYEDECLKNLLYSLNNNNIHVDNTTFIITADHGDEFGEHGGIGHELKLYNEMLKVPLIFYGKDVKNYSYLSNELIELKSVPEFILSFANNRFVNNFNKKFIISESLREKDDFSGHVRLISIQNKEYKLIYDCVNQKNNEFYDISNDKYEQINLTHKPQFKNIMRLMEIEIKKYLKNTISRQNRDAFSSKEENEIIKERLKNLGYID
ncbi:MAG: sulfatase [Candidatus Helarchaeota archaeon]